MVALEAIASAIGYIAQALFLGFLAAASFLLPKGGPTAVRRKLLSMALVCLLFFIVTAVGTLLIQGAKLQRGEFPGWEILSRYLSATQSGNIWLFRESYGVVLTLILVWLIRQKEALTGLRLLTILAVPLIASRGFTSHAIAVRSDTALAVTADGVHLVATALWAGGLLAVLTALRANRRQQDSIWWTAQLVQRFSRLALACVVVLCCAGLYLSWVHVGSFAILKNTDSGNVLIVKLALFAIMLGLAALNAFSTRPALQRATLEDKQRQAKLNTAIKRIAWESMFGLAIFVTTGFLTVLPPGVHALHAAAQQQPAPAKTPTLHAAEGASVKILSPKNDESFSGDQVALRFKLTKGKQGHHAHAYVDGELMGMFEGSSGTLNGIKPGKHVLELRVVADDHQTELDASDKVNFTVR